MATKTYQDARADWTVLHNNLAAQLEAMPHLSGDHAALTALLAEAQALEDLQEKQRAALRETNQKRGDIFKRGRELRNRIVAGLRQFFGLESEKLIEFGVSPRPRDIRRRTLTLAERAELAAAEAAEAAARLEADLAVKSALQVKSKAAR